MSKCFAAVVVAGIVFFSASSERTAAAPLELVVQGGHTGKITSVAFSPDSQRAVTCSRDGRAILWDLPTGRLLRVFDARAGGCYGAAISPDGKTLVTGHWGQKCVAWELATGKELYRVSTAPLFQFDLLAKTDVDLIRFDPDGRRFWANGGTNFYGYDTDTGKWNGKKTPPGPAVQFEVSGGRRLLYTYTSQDGCRAVYDFDLGKVVSEVRPPVGKEKDYVIYYRLLSPDGRYEAREYSIRPDTDTKYFSIWDVEKKVELRVTPIAKDKGWIEPRAFTDAKHVLVLNATRYPWALDLIDVETGVARTLEGPDGSVHSDKAFVSPDSQWLATVYENHARIWDIRAARHVTELGTRKQRASFAVLPTSDRKVVYTVRGGGLDRWSTVTGKPERVWAESGKEGIVALEHLPSHKRLIVGTSGGMIHFVDAETFRTIGTQPTPKTAGIISDRDEEINRVAVSRDEAAVLVAYGTAGGLLNFSGASGALIFRLPDGEPVANLRCPTGSSLYSADLSADGKSAVMCSRDKSGDEKNPYVYTVRLWNVSTKTQTGTISVPSAGIPRFTEDGKHIVLCTYKDVIVYDTQTRNRIRQLKVHNYVGEGFLDRLFQDDLPAVARLRGTVFVSGGADGRTVVWDAATGRVGRELTNHLTPILATGPFGPGRLFSAAEDGTLTILDEAAGTVLGTMWLNEGHWLLTTPEGLFDGSLGGRERVSFRVGKGLTVVPVDRFFQDFYYPGLLAAIWKGERPKPTVDFAAQTPPAVRFTTPKTNAVVKDESVEVIVEATDQGGGVSGPFLYHNGTRILAGVETQKVEKVTRRTFRVKLVEGENKLTGKAASGDGGWESEPAHLVVTLAKLPVRPDLYVLAVGINEYADERIKLSFAAADARGFGGVFERRGKSIYAAVHVTYLLDAQATRAGLSTALEKIARAAQPRDTFVLTLSGHGTTLGQRYYFLPHEFDGKKFPTTEDNVKKQGIPIDELGEWLSQVAALKKVLILDTCGSGGTTGLLQKGRNPFAFRGEIERLNRSQGVFTIAACAAGEEAQEAKDLGHGLLTYALLAGLRAVAGGPLEGKGVSPSNHQQVVDVLEWFAFASGQAPGLMKRYFGREQEVHTSSSGTSFPLLPVRDR